MFSSLKRFHISFSFVLLFSSFLFFQQFIFFCHLTPFLFLFFYSFLHLFLFDLVKVIYVYRFLFLDICLIAYCFIVLWVFSQGTFQFFFVHVRFKIERLLFGGALLVEAHSYNSDTRNFSLCRYVYRIWQACTLFKACRSSRPHFYLPTFYPMKTDLSFLSRLCRHRK